MSAGAADLGFASTIGTARLRTDVLTDQQLQRAWALGYARLVFPAANPLSIERIARWIDAGGTS